MYRKIITTGFFILICGTAAAQADSLKLNFDLRTRAELDNGARTLIQIGKSAETAVVSRARMGIDYYYQKLRVYVSVQDVRTWGETSTNASKNQNFILNEAWAHYRFSQKAELKVGRQVLAYDNERLIGALDWAMQGRSFDALKGIFIISPASKIETVIGYHNDDNDANDLPDKEIYSIAEAGEITKSFQIVHYQFSRNNKFRFSAIALNSVLQNPSGMHYDLLTAGVNAKKSFGKVGFFGSAYYQTGKNTAGQSKAAYEFSVNADFLIGSKFNTVLGTEWLSGTKNINAPQKNRSFSPLYGTNHLYNGFMDYFYSGTSHYNSIGLNDYYQKSTYTFSNNSVLQANFHAFAANATPEYDPTGHKPSSYLGSEADLVYTHKAGKMITVNLGQSFMFAGEGMESIKKTAQPKKLQTWTWIAVRISPSFRLK